MIKINLLAERRATPGKVRRTPKIEVGASAENLLYGAILVLAIVFSGYKWWSLSTEMTQVAAQLDAANQEVERVREGLRIIAELEAKKALIEKQVDIISQLKRARTLPVSLMNEVNANLPDFIWFHSMAEKKNQISFSGRATTSNAPANLYNNLAQSPFFADVTLNQITKDATGVNFSLSCTFAPDALAAPPG